MALSCAGNMFWKKSHDIVYVTLNHPLITKRDISHFILFYKRVKSQLLGMKCESSRLQYFVPQLKIKVISNSRPFKIVGRGGETQLKNGWKFK